MAVSAPSFTTLEAALDDIGQAWVFVGDPFTTGGMACLGLTPGDISPSMNPEFQDRVYPEYQRQPVASKLVGFDVQVDIPLIWGDPTVYAKVSPTGAASGGHTSPQNVTYSTLLLISTEEVAGGLEFTAGSPGTWVSPAGGPEHAVWIPKGYFQGAFPTFGSHNTENKNRTGTVTFTGILASAANWPEGTKSWIIGDPLDFSVTGLDI